MKELGYDIKNDVRLSYEDGEGVLRIISDNQSIVGFTEQLVAHNTVDVYVECLNATHGKRLPEILLPASGSDSDSG